MGLPCPGRTVGRAAPTLGLLTGLRLGRCAVSGPYGGGGGSSLLWNVKANTSRGHQPYGGHGGKTNVSLSPREGGGEGCPGRPPSAPPQQSQDRVLSGSSPHLAAPSSLAWAQRCPGADPVKPLVPFEVVFGFGNGGFAQEPGAGAQSRSRAAYQGPQAGYRGFVPETWGCRAGHDV